MPRDPSTPSVAPSSLAPLRARWFFLFGFVYLYAFPYFAALRSANETPRILMTQEMVDHHRFWLDTRTNEMGSQLDLSRGPDGHLYPNKAPGPSFVAVPGYWLCKLVGARSLRACTWVFRVTAVTLPALLFLPFFYRLARRFFPDEPSTRAALAAYALGSPALVYGVLFFSHQLAAVCAGGAFCAAVSVCRDESRRPRAVSALAGGLAAAAVMMDYQSILASFVIGLYLVVRAPHKARTLMWFAVGAAPVVILLCAYHSICFGAPWKTGYAFSFDTVTRQGVMGIVGPSLPSVRSTLWAPSNGLFVLAPWVALAFVGAVAIARDARARARVGAEALVAIIVFVIYLLFVSSLVPYMARGGWAVGPRYLTVALPFTGWLAVAGFGAAERTRATALIARALVVVGVVIYVVAITTYPHWPDALANPLHELSLRLLAHGYGVHSLGTLLGLRGVMALVPLFAAVTGALFVLLARARGDWKTPALALLLGIAIVFAYRWFPRSGPYADHVWSFVTGTWEPR